MSDIKGFPGKYCSNRMNCLQVITKLQNDVLFQIINFQSEIRNINLQRLKILAINLTDSRKCMGKAQKTEKGKKK